MLTVCANVSTDEVTNNIVLKPWTYVQVASRVVSSAA
jgi:hypothetical protein